MIARDLCAGGEFVDGVLALDPRVPAGGVKNSGYGREMSISKRWKISIPLCIRLGP